MTSSKKIQKALISCFYKDNLEKIVNQLNQLGVEIISTGGTFQFIKNLGVKVTSVEDITGFPSILDGRVKTLHPSIFGSILYRRENENDIKTKSEYKLHDINLVIVDLYPFDETVEKGGTHEEIIEKIDIGGVSLIRASAKNYHDVLIVSNKNDYEKLIQLLENKKGYSDVEDRLYFANQAFLNTFSYDNKINSYFNTLLKNNLPQKNIQYPFLTDYPYSVNESYPMRYGENPHQQGVFFGNLNDFFEQLHGKPLSYNNLVDVDAAVNLINEFKNQTFAIIKHTNACGVASDANQKTCYLNALSCDPVSAFGGVIITNHKVNLECAVELNKLFFEIIIAPGYDLDALEILKSKKNRIILKQKIFSVYQKEFKTLLNGILMQDKDYKSETENDLKTVTQRRPTISEIESLLYANKIVKHTKSNTIVLAVNNQLLASGTGQTSRVDALIQAITKAKKFGFSLENAVMASDAFFPFPDCVEIAGKEGVKAVIQPGGSIKDQESIDYCNKNGITMVFTGNRHFKH